MNDRIPTHMHTYALCLAGLLALATLASTVTAQSITERLPPPPPPPPQTSLSVSVAVSPTTVYVGGTLALTVTVMLSNTSTTLGSFSGTCTGSGYDFGLTLPVGGSFPSYRSSDTQYVDAPDEAGEATVTCSVTAHLNNGTSDTASGSTTFNVISCQGKVNPIPAPSIQETGQAANSSTWNGLTGTVEPSGNVSSAVSTSGSGITGQLYDPSLPSSLLDCDGQPNDDISPQNASIEGLAEPPANSQVVFTWTVTSFSYSMASPCDSCEQNPSGHYPITSATPFVMPNATSISQYCQK